MSRILRAIIMGPPGSGKGTISSRIVRDFKLTHLSTGDVLRNQMQQKTEAGKLAEQYIHEGHLVPDSIMVRLIANELLQIKNSWLLDGFPRTLGQASALSEIHTIDTVINLDVPFEAIINRIEGRWIHPGSGRVYNLEWNPPKEPFKDDETGEPLIQRDDDRPETVRERLNAYDDLTLPVLEHYRRKDLLHEFHGTETDKIWPHVRDYMSTLIKKSS